MSATDSKSEQKEVLKVWYLITLLKLSGPGEIRAHIKAIKIIMENSEGSPSEDQDAPTVRTIVGTVLLIKSPFFIYL